MRTTVCETLGIEYPIFAFSHCRDVVAAVSRAGGFGVFGAASFAPDRLDEALTWLDANTSGRPYGIDFVFPVIYEGDDPEEMRSRIPQSHIDFVNSLTDRFGIPARHTINPDPGVRGHERARQQWAVALNHRVDLVASALGPLPADLQEEAHSHGIITAGLVGAPRHAERHVEAGTDIIVAQGSEAGGHTGEISTFVLVPQVVDAVSPRPVLAAGGVGDGRHVATAMALGAQGVWTGSIWLTTAESDVHPLLKQKLLRASSVDTIRSKCRTGKPVRQLRTPWVDAWESPEAPEPLPAPLQQLLVRDATMSTAEHGIEDPLGTPVGQVVGMMRAERPCSAVIYSLIEEYVEAVAQIASLTSAADTSE